MNVAWYLVSICTGFLYWSRFFAQCLKTVQLVLHCQATVFLVEVGTTETNAASDKFLISGMLGTHVLVSS